MVWYWIPALSWMSLVLLASTDPLSAKHTGEILGAILTWMFGHISTSTFNHINFFIRKSAHFTEYAVLSALWFRALRIGFTELWKVRWALFGLAISLAVAILDEWHQSFVPSRTSSPRDVLLDFCGALFAQFLIWYSVRRHELAAS